MAYECLVGAGQFDAVAYVRAMIEDTSATPVIPDASFVLYVQATARDISRHLPLDYTVGSALTQTSPFVTVPNQQVYVCTSGNGFTVAPSRITQLLYSVVGDLNASSEINYLALLPVSPFSRFLFSPNLLDSPSERILRDEYYGELAHYGHGRYAVQRDPATGRLAVAFYPTPTTVLNIYCTYQGAHQDSGTAPVIANGSVYATIPDDFAQTFGSLLYARVLEEEGDRLAKTASAKAGLIALTSDPGVLEAKAQRIRDEAFGELGGNSPAVIHSQF